MGIPLSRIKKNRYVVPKTIGRIIYFRKEISNFKVDSLPKEFFFTRKQKRFC
jgi:hypothetical protein